MIDNREPSRTVSRRGFLKVAGAAAGVAGLTVASRKALAYAPAKETVPSGLIRAAIKTVDGFPYELGNVQRYPRRQSPQGDPDGFAAYLGASTTASRKKNLQTKMQAQEPGYTLIDAALHDAAVTSKRALMTQFYSWAPLAAKKPLGQWQGTPEQASNIIKKVGRLFGAGDVGIAATNPLWFFSTTGTSKDEEKPIVFTNEATAAADNPDGVLLPSSLKWTIVIVIPQDLQWMQFTPSSLGEAATMHSYSRMAEVVGKVSEFIRFIGYQAVPMENEIALSVPMAIEAGLGELGRNGILIHPVFGPNLRLVKLITDLPLAPDKPISFGVHAFCKTCKKCARECPSGGIPMDDDFNGLACASNNPGPKKWNVDTWKCFKFWNDNGASCSTCQRVCPYSKPQTWAHDMVKGLSAATPLLDPLFIAMDDLMGYGTTYDRDDAKDFWESTDWPTKA